MGLFRLILPLAIALLAAAASAQARDLGNMNSTEIEVLQRRLIEGGCYQIAARCFARLRRRPENCVIRAKSLTRFI